MPNTRGELPRTARYLFLSSILFAVLLVALSFVGMWKAGMFWHDEENVLSSAAAWATHQPLYPSPHAPEIYGLLYGPVTFLIYSLPLHFAPTSLPLLRAMVLAGTLLLFLFLYKCARHFLSVELALGMTGYAACLLYTQSVILLGFRADLWVLLAFAIATYAALKRSPFLCAFALAAAVDMKANMAILAAATLVLLGLRVSRSRFAAACGVTLLAAGSVFLLPRISLANYLGTLRMAAHHGFLKHLFVYNVFYWVIILLIPAASAWLVYTFSPDALRKLLQQYWLALGLYALAALAAIVTGSKNGSGEWQLWSMIPAVVAATAKMLQLRFHLIGSDEVSISRTAHWIWMGSLIVTVLFGLRFTRRTVHNVLELPPRSIGNAIIGDINSVRKAYPGDPVVIGPGWNGDELPYLYNYVAVAEGNPYLVDQNAVAEDSLGGVPLQEQSLQLWMGCGNRVWLFPAGNRPFLTHDSYADEGGKPLLFPKSLIEGFVSTHHIAQHLEYYDVWVCR